MTQARLATAPPDASGITPALCDALHAAFEGGHPTGQLLVVGLLEVGGCRKRRTSKGVHRLVELSWIDLEVVGEPADAAQLREQLVAIRETRQDGGTQGVLPLEVARHEDERKKELLDLADEWADAGSLDLKHEWASYFGLIENDNIRPDHGPNADPARASLLQVREFCASRGIIDDPWAGPDADRKKTKPTEDDEAGDDGELDGDGQFGAGGGYDTGAAQGYDPEQGALEPPLDDTEPDGEPGISGPLFTDAPEKKTRSRRKT